MLPQMLYYMILESVGEIPLVSQALAADAKIQSISLHGPFPSTLMNALKITGILDSKSISDR